MMSSNFELTKISLSAFFVSSFISTLNPFLSACSCSFTRSGKFYYYCICKFLVGPQNTWEKLVFDGTVLVGLSRSIAETARTEKNIISNHFNIWIQGNFLSWKFGWIVFDCVYMWVPDLPRVAWLRANHGWQSKPRKCSRRLGTGALKDLIPMFSMTTISTHRYDVLDLHSQFVSCYVLVAEHNWHTFTSRPMFSEANIPQDF